MASVCQAASALIEPSDSAAPAWLQAARQIGSLYSAASSADSYAANSGAANPLWSLWSAFSGGSSAPPAAASSSNESSPKSSSSPSTGSSSGKSHAAASSSVVTLVNLLNPLMSFFAPNLQRTASDSSQPEAVGHSTKHADNRQAGKLGQSQGFGSNLRTISNLLLTGLSLVGLYDWLGSAPSLGALITPTATSFARRKKPFDPGETFVDTPASLAAMASAKSLAPGVANSGQLAALAVGKQPPTPCPSVEEYISPTFARNYQGAWKYVVQIPHEGYFTQTIQRSSCVRQRCEFTEGVCHEAPRWVSLLVAEIYYPNAIFGSPTAAGGPQPQQQVAELAAHQQQQPQQSAPANQLNQRVSLVSPFDDAQNAALLSQLMSTAPSNSHLQQVSLGNQNSNSNNNNSNTAQQHQAKSLGGANSLVYNNPQDPLQMTDSLNTYNHNLNSAFFSAAAELGLDPTNLAQMQQLASAHNYQLMQRNGLAPEAQGESSAAEPRSRFAGGQAQAQQTQASRTQLHLDTANSQQQALANDYIRALAIETIRQNPHLSIDDLIKSLQLQQTRRKRDLSPAAMQQQNQPHPQQAQATRQATGAHVAPAQKQQRLQVRSGPAQATAGDTTTAAQSMSELGAAVSLARQQQQQHAHQPSGVSMPSGDRQVDVAANSIGGAYQTAAGTSSEANQIECDGHDKIGCYVVRVYYDWFLVNGSCKCWKTDLVGARADKQPASSSSSPSSSGTGSFIRRIFTG